MEMEDMNVLISQYPAIAAKAAEIGKIKQGMLNKKQYAQSIEQWKSFTPEELAKLNSEIASAPVVMKKAVFTQTAICYNSESVFHCVPVKDLVWVYARVVKESMNFIPTNKLHQLWMMDRNGSHFLVAMLNTGAFSKKAPASDAVESMAQLLKPVRPGIIFGYSKEIEAFCNSNPAAAAQKVDTDSQL